MEHSTIIGGAQWLPKGDPKVLEGLRWVLAVKVTAEEETPSSLSPFGCVSQRPTTGL